MYEEDEWDRSKSFARDQLGIEAICYTRKPALACGDVHSDVKLPMKTENTDPGCAWAMRKSQSSKGLECSDLGCEFGVPRKSVQVFNKQ
jgi:hypothetical protein